MHRATYAQPIEFKLLMKLLGFYCVTHSAMWLRGVSEGVHTNSSQTAHVYEEELGRDVYNANHHCAVVNVEDETQQDG